MACLGTTFTFAYIIVVSTLQKDLGLYSIYFLSKQLRIKLWTVIIAESAISYHNEGECCIAYFCTVYFVVCFVSCRLRMCACVCVLPDIDMDLFHIQLSSEMYVCVCVSMLVSICFDS
jgi:hypothetical protein